MTRAGYEQHLGQLGSWAELMPSWEVVMESEKLRDQMVTGVKYLPGVRWDHDPDERPADPDAPLLVRAGDWDGLAKQADKARRIALMLLQHTSLTPSEVRERWPEEAEWLLGEKG